MPTTNFRRNGAEWEGTRDGEDITAVLEDTRWSPGDPRPAWCRSAEAADALFEDWKDEEQATGPKTGDDAREATKAIIAPVRHMALRTPEADDRPEDYSVLINPAQQAAITIQEAAKGIENSLNGSGWATEEHQRRDAVYTDSMKALRETAADLERWNETATGRDSHPAAELRHRLPAAAEILSSAEKPNDHRELPWMHPDPETKGEAREALFEAMMTSIRGWSEEFQKDCALRTGLGLSGNIGSRAAEAAMLEARSGPASHPGFYLYAVTRFCEANAGNAILTGNREELERALDTLEEIARDEENLEVYKASPVQRHYATKLDPTFDDYAGPLFRNLGRYGDNSG